MNASSESGLCAATISRGRGVISQEEYIPVYTGCSRNGKGDSGLTNLQSRRRNAKEVPGVPGEQYGRARVECRARNHGVIDNPSAHLAQAQNPGSKTTPTRLPDPRPRLSRRSFHREAVRLAPTNEPACASGPRTIRAKHGRGLSAVRAGQAAHHRRASCAHETRARTKATGSRNWCPERRRCSTPRSLRAQLANCLGHLRLSKRLLTRRRDCYQQRAFANQFSPCVAQVRPQSLRRDNRPQAPDPASVPQPLELPLGLPIVRQNQWWFSYHHSTISKGKSRFPIRRPQVKSGRKSARPADKDAGRRILRVDRLAGARSASIGRCKPSSRRFPSGVFPGFHLP
jgi:hypothetical protein